MHPHHDTLRQLVVVDQHSAVGLDGVQWITHLVGNRRVNDLLERLFSHDLLVQGSKRHILEINNEGILVVDLDLSLDHCKHQEIIIVVFV